MRETNSMSCSMITMERPGVMRLRSSAVCSRSPALMPATGSSSMSSSGSCMRSMPISSHCFWPWLRRAPGVSRSSARKISPATLWTRSTTSAVRVKAMQPATPRPRGKETSRFSKTVRFS